LVSNKIKNMKQLLSLFLFLLPCLALAQYPSNGNQKITLGEQTTADGLIWRGVASDTTLTAKSDTAAYFVLDTVNINLYTYKASATGRKWIQVETDSASIAYVNTYGTQTVNGAKTFTSAVTATRFNPTANTATGTGMFLPATNTLGFSTNGNQKLTISTNGNLGINTTNTDVIGYGTSGMLSLLSDTDDGAALAIGKKGTSGATTGTLGDLNFYGQNGGTTSVARALMRGGLDGATNNTYYAFFTASAGVTDEAMRIRSSREVNIGYGGTDNGAFPLQVNGQIFATSALIATSDIKFKENIQPLDKGLEIINKLKPVKFNFISTTENNFSEFDEIGFIAQDVEGALSTELFAKAVVKKFDEGKEDSPLGLMTEKFIPILVKAIQEQNLLIKALEQRIINLENK
jgi:hypothetical protein